MNKSIFVVTVIAGVIALAMIMSTIMTSDVLADSMFHISNLDNKSVCLQIIFIHTRSWREFM